MKKVILIAASFFAFATTTNAQQKTTTSQQQTQPTPKQKLTPEMRAQKTVDELVKEVNLTEDQKPKIYGIALERAKKIDEIRTKYKGQKENKELAKQEIGAIRKESRKDVMASLSPEQVAQQKAKHKEMKPAGKKNALDQPND